MKRTIIIIAITVLFVLIHLAAFVALKWKSVEVTDPLKLRSDEKLLALELDEYNSILDGELPQDLTIKIYWRWNVDTNKPLSVEEITSYSVDFKQTIVVTSEEIERHLDSLKRINSSTIQATDAEHYVNVGLYYVIEAKEGWILKVSLNSCKGTDEAVSAYVNGFKVKPNPALYEAILPFISEEDREILGLYEEGIIPKDE